MEEQNFISQAAGKFVRISPQKCRLVADLVRDRYVGEALTILRFSPKKKAGTIIEKVLRSAIANAQQKIRDIDVDHLYVGKIFIDAGPTWKRIRPAPMGRAYRVIKRTSHVHIYLEERKGR